MTAINGWDLCVWSQYEQYLFPDVGIFYTVNLLTTTSEDTINPSHIVFFIEQRHGNAHNKIAL